METQKNKAPAFGAMIAAMLSGQWQQAAARRFGRQRASEAKKNRSWSMPHQGKRECARRVRQMAAGKYDMAQVVRHG